MLVNVSQMNPNASATTVVMKNAAGTTMTTATLPNVSSTITNVIGYGLSTTDGTLMTGTLFNISTTVGESLVYEIAVRDAWSNDGNVLYLPVGYYGMNTSTFYSWVSGSTWTTRFNMTTPRSTSGNSRITNYITRLPLGSTGSSWSYYQIVNSLPEDAGNFWMRTCGVGTVADGNVFLFACFQYRSVPVGAQSYTLNGTAVNLNSSSPWNPFAVWRFTDSNGTFSTPQSIVATSTAADSGYQLGGGNGLNTNLPIMKNTQLGNSFLRIITTTTLSTAVTSSFGGRSPGNLLASQTVVPVVIDIPSNLAVRNFNVITSNVTSVNTTSSMGSASLKYGPSIDGSYTIGTGFSNMIKVSQNGTL
jgi:hypothetical protein